MKSLSSFVSQHKPFLRWWLMFTSLCVGAYIALSNGLIQRFLEVDLTNISLVILGIFTLFTIITGIDTYRVEKPGAFKGVCDRAKVGWFFSDALMTIGMLGTVVGFIMMLEGDITAAKTALASMSKGMGVALYTTAAGVACGLLLKIQLFNLNMCLEELDSDPVSCTCKK